uniref:TWiK family of potassium channels protein 18 n=1 Tax=Anisakis simplex TaxID=6269 RepID=A0A346RVM2_ANISI|nr:TWiK family of potassium channels protein 18 [Anisakis simplex]
MTGYRKETTIAEGLMKDICYGDVACYTVAGRVVTVLYACVGIPLMLITLNDLGKFLYKAINRIVKLCKCRKCCTFFKTKPQQIAPSVSTCYEQDVELGLPNVGRSVSTVQQDSVEFQLSIDADEVMTTDESNEVNLEQELVQPGPPPRMPVMVAVGVTVGWIFFCAALFKVWEANWTYAESCYFMFISLSTIGLGDVAVKRRDLMVICFVFVIVGLSLVSMCINVIQTAIEDVYMKLLMRLLVEYQSKLAEGGDQVDASKGMMKMWGGNHAAKYLMPLLSKDKRMTAMAKVQDEAEAQGIEIPPIFSDLDDDSGMPKILTIDNDRKDSQMSILQAIDHAKHSMLHVPAPPSSSSLSLVCLDAEIQTDNHVYLDKEEQTESTEMRDSGIDTEIRFASYICTAVQCGDGDMERINDETQTVVIEMNSAEVMTYCEPSTVDVVQTDDVQCTDAALQTQLFECLQMETQTDFIDYDYTQKMLIETNETETQTDEIDVTRTNHRVKRARTWARDYRQDQPKRLSPSKIQEESDSSEESLDWNPIDGMHAEKQRPVRDLTRFFDKIRSPKSAEK